MANYLVTDAQLQAIANKIRQKTGSSAAIQFYSAFVSEIEKLTDTRDANASASDILNGKTAYVNKNKVTGNIPSKGSNDVTVSGNTVSVPTGHYPSAVQKTVGTAKAAATYNTSGSDQNIDAGQYLSGAQTIKAVTTQNIDAGNIKYGVNVKVGDANSAGRIKNVTGSFTGDANATADDILAPKTAYVKGQKVVGNIYSFNADTYNTHVSDRLLPKGYCNGISTIKGVTTSNIDAGNIKAGVNVKVGDANNAGRIKNVTGTYVTPVKVVSSQYVNQSNITVDASGTLCAYFDLQISNAKVTADKCKPILDCLPTTSGWLVRGDISSGGVTPQVTLSDITGGIRISLYLRTSSGGVIIGANGVSLNYGIAMPDI
jgi:hypothetical protein